MHLTLVLSLIGIGFFSNSALARWAAPEEATYAVNFDRSRYEINADGSYSLTSERQIEILKDKARTDLGLLRLTFDAHSSTLDLEEAKTINPKKTTQVRKEHIEIKPLASSGPGFDEKRQVTIAFPDVAVGSKLYYRYRRKIRKPSIPDFFSKNFALGWNELVQNFELTYASERPLYVQVNDPDESLEVIREQDGKLVKLRLKKPIFRRVMEEDDISIEPKSLLWIAVSTIGSWDEFPLKIPEIYETYIKSELPPKLEKIRQKAALHSDPVKQINTVTSQLAGLIHYVGDWVPVEGLFQPRPLPLVLETAFGDCKDFTSLTAIILDKLGFETHAAWILRGTNWLASPITIPALHLNHAIVWARKKGRTFWVDPTNTTSFAQGIYEDISARQALVLKPGDIRRERTPALDPSQSAIKLSFQHRFRKSSHIKTEGKFSLLGRAAQGMTAKGLSYEKSQLDFSLLRWLSNPNKLSDWKFSEYDLRSRVVSDLDASFSYRERWNPVTTSAGKGYLVGRIPYMDDFQFEREKRVSGIYFRDPKSWKRETSFLGKSVLLRTKGNCKIRSRWLDFQRSFRKRKGRVTLVEELKVKQARVPLTDIQSPAFAHLQEEVANCAQTAVVVFQ